MTQLHSAECRNAAQLPDGDALVVASVNSGVQNIQDLSATHREA